MKRSIQHHDLWSHNYPVWGTAAAYTWLFGAAIAQIFVAFFVTIYLSSQFAPFLFTGASLANVLIAPSACLAVGIIYGHIHPSDSPSSCRFCRNFYSTIAIALTIALLCAFHLYRQEVIEHTFYAFLVLIQLLDPATMLIILLHDYSQYRNTFDVTTKALTTYSHDFPSYIKAHNKTRAKT